MIFSSSPNQQLWGRNAGALSGLLSSFVCLLVFLLLTNLWRRSFVVLVPLVFPVLPGASPGVARAIRSRKECSRKQDSWTGGVRVPSRQLQGNHPEVWEEEGTCRREKGSFLIFIYNCFHKMLSESIRSHRAFHRHICSVLFDYNPWWLYSAKLLTANSKATFLFSKLGFSSTLETWLASTNFVR